jgi:DNA-binding response OmpR family regulator
LHSPSRLDALVNPVRKNRGTPLPLKGKKILVAEDEPLIGLDLCTLLNEAGGRTSLFDSWGNATDALRADSFDAAIVDNSLIDGPSDALCALLKKRGIPFLLYTGKTDAEVAHLGPHVVTKPAPSRVLITKMAEVMGVLA